MINSVQQLTCAYDDNGDSLQQLTCAHDYGGDYLHRLTYVYDDGGDYLQRLTCVYDDGGDDDASRRPWSCRNIRRKQIGAGTSMEVGLRINKQAV